MNPRTMEIIEQISKETGLDKEVIIKKLKKRSIEIGVPFDEIVEIHWYIRTKTREVLKRGI